jgi:hypothetical protein
MFAFLADYAYAHPDGRLYVVGGAFNKLFAPAFPFDCWQLSLVMKLEFPQEAMGEQFPLVIDVSDSEGVSLNTGEFAIEVPNLPLLPDELPEVHVVWNVHQARFPIEGLYHFEMLVDGQSIGRLPLRVVLPDVEPLG